MPESYKDIKPGKWRRFELTEDLDSDLPGGLKFAGNYAAFFNRKCLYVGQSNNLKRRLKSHIRLFMFSSNWQTSWGTYTRIIIAIRKEKFRFERMTIEARLIHRLNPIFNGLSVGQVISKRKELYLEFQKGDK